MNAQSNVLSASNSDSEIHFYNLKLFPDCIVLNIFKSFCNFFSHSPFFCSPLTANCLLLLVQLLLDCSALTDGRRTRTKGRAPLCRLLSFRCEVIDKKTAKQIRGKTIASLTGNPPKPLFSPPLPASSSSTRALSSGPDAGGDPGP